MRWGFLLLLLFTSAHADQRIMCIAVDIELYERRGWKPLTTSNRLIVENLQKAGKAEIGFLPGSLACTQWVNGSNKPVTNAGLWYWRNIQISSN